MALRGFPPYAWTPTVLNEYLDYLTNYIPEKALPAANIEDVFVVENIIMRPAQGIVEFSGESIPFNFNGDLSSFFHKLSDYMSARGEQLRVPNFVYDTTGMPILKDDKGNFYDPVDYTKLSFPDINVEVKVTGPVSDLDLISYYGNAGIASGWSDYCHYIPRNPLEYLKEHHDNGIDSFLEALKTGLEDTSNCLNRVLAIREQYKCKNWGCDNCLEEALNICSNTMYLLTYYASSAPTYMYTKLFEQLGKGVSHLAAYIGVEIEELLSWIADEKTYENNVENYMAGRGSGAYVAPGVAIGWDTVSGKPFYSHGVEYALGPETDDEGKITGIWVGYMLPKRISDYSFLNNYSVSLNDGEKVVGVVVNSGDVIKETSDAYYFAHLINLPYPFPNFYYYTYDVNVTEHSVKPIYIYKNKKDNYPTGMLTDIRGMPMFFDPAEPLVIPHGTVKFNNLTAKYDYINYMIDKGKIKPIDEDDREALNMNGRNLTLRYAKLPFIQRITRYNYPSITQAGTSTSDINAVLPSWNIDLGLPQEYEFDFEVRVPCTPNLDATFGSGYQVSILAQRFDQNGNPVGGVRECGSGYIKSIAGVTPHIRNSTTYSSNDCASGSNRINVTVKGYNGEVAYSEVVSAGYGEYKIVRTSLSVDKLKTTDGSKMLDARLAQI